ncbi:MAG: ferritin family protein [Candidatus Zixiibacteriota bacterium]|nr:MAG: ferritin family protein [candidate division Zixibacteria bacterium]
MSPVHPDTLAALTAGIQSEVASYVFYLEAAKKTVADKHRNILEKLALEEKEHFRVLERQYDSLIRSEKWISTADILKQEGLPEITEEMSHEHRDLIDKVGEADSMSKILDIAYRLEEDARDLFASAKNMVDSEEGRKMFEQLTKFEEGHMRMISEMKASLG